MKLGEAYYKLARYPAHLFFLTYVIFLIGLILSSFFTNAVLFLALFVVGTGFIAGHNIWRFPMLTTIGSSALGALTTLGVYLWVGTSSSVFPLDLQFLILVVGILSITTLAGVGAVVALPFRRFRKHLQVLNKEDREEREKKKTLQILQKSRYSDRLKELTTVVLIMFSLQFVVLPSLQNVVATTNQSEVLSSEEFIKTFDPEAEYETNGEPVDTEPKPRIPKDPDGKTGSGNQTETGAPGTGETQNDSPDTPAAELSAEEKRLETLKQLNLNTEILLELYENGEISTAEFGELTAHSLSEGKITLGDMLKSKQLAAAAAAFMDKYPVLKQAFEKLQPFIHWAFPGLGLLIEAYKLDQAHGGHVTKTLGAAYDASVRMAEGAGTFIRENPESIGIVIAIGVAATVATVVTVPLCGGCGGAVLLWGVGAVGTTMTAITLGAAFAEGGTDGVLQEIFSEEVLEAAARGDWDEVIGGGSIELVAFVFMNMPNNPVKVMQALDALTSLKALDSGSDIANLIQSLRNAKQAFATLQKAVQVTDAGMQFLGLLIKEQALKGAYAVDDFLTFLTQPGALNRNYAYLGLDGNLAANLNKQGEQMQNLQALGFKIDEAKQVAGEQWDGFVAMVGGGGGRSVYLGYLDVDVPAWTNTNQFKHSLGGEINGNQLKGLHHIPSNGNVKNISTQANYKSNSHGFYEADVEVEINGQRYTKIKSTMWPDNWSQEKIANEVDIAFNKKIAHADGGYRGTTSQGVEIRFYNRDGSNYNFFPAL